MVVVSYSGKEINAKLVYYGAGLSGKTTNLESIYEAVPESSRGKMVSMKTQSDRTLFFDLLPLDLGEIMGFKTRFLLYTVPGQVFYNATRKLVLKGADAIVFVADSEVGKMDENKESLANLRANLIEYDLKLDEIPWVIQYNKRDLANVYTLDELNAELNPGALVPAFEAVATQGKGVFETFRGISHLLMEKVTRELRRAPSSGRPIRTEDPSIRSAASTAPATPATPAAPAIPISAMRSEAPVAATPPFVPASPTPTTPTFRAPAATPPAAPVIPAPAAPAHAPVAANGAEDRRTVPGTTSPIEASRGMTSGPLRPESQTTPYQYGRELALPAEDRIGSTSAPDTSPPFARDPDSLRPIEASETPIAFESRTASRPVPTSTPVDSTSRTEPRAAVGLRQSAIDLADRTDSTPSRPSVAIAPSAPTAAEAPGAAAGATELVVPVSIPRGASREVVLRIVITHEAD